MSNEKNVTENELFSKEDFENVAKSKKWYLSTPLVVILAIAIPFTVLAGPIIFSICYIMEIILLILMVKNYNASFNLLKDKMLDINKIYSNQNIKIETKNVIKEEKVEDSNTLEKISEKKTEFEVEGFDGIKFEITSSISSNISGSSLDDDAIVEFDDDKENSAVDDLSIETLVEENSISDLLGKAKAANSKLNK